jgi:hypothetical protein
MRFVDRNQDRACPVVGKPGGHHGQHNLTNRHFGDFAFVWWRLLRARPLVVRFSDAATADQHRRLAEILEEAVADQSHSRGSGTLLSEKDRRFRALARVVRHRPMSSQWTQGYEKPLPQVAHLVPFYPAKFFTVVTAGKHRTETKTFSGYLSLEGSAKATSFVPGVVP